MLLEFRHLGVRFGALVEWGIAALAFADRSMDLANIVLLPVSMGS